MLKNTTLDKIVKSSIEIFSKLPYEEVALSQICQHASISNGSIYNYFKTKEELFRYLLKETIVRIEHCFKKISGKTTLKRLECFIALTLQITKDELPLITIYREGQYKFIGYEEKLRTVYINALEKVFQRKIKDTEYLYIMSGIRFINIYYTKNNLPLDIDFLCVLILKGFSMEIDFHEINLKDKILFEISPFQKNNKKVEILEIGEKFFGETGYHKTKITDITSALDISTGSFYNYYQNKEVLLWDITRKITDSALFFMKYNASNSSTSLERNFEYLYLLSLYFEKKPYRYEILREAEFVSEELSARYTTELEKLFATSFQDSGVEEKNIHLICSYLMGLSHYIGIELFFLKNFSDIGELFLKLSEHMEKGIEH